MEQQKETTLCFKQNCGSSIQYKQSWHSKDFHLMEWAFVRTSNISSELYISQMSWSELILWFQGNLQRGLSPPQSAKQFTARQNLLKLSPFFFQSATAGCTEVGRWCRIHHFAWVLWTKPGRCVTCRKGALCQCTCAQVTLIPTCINTHDVPSCAASKSKCSCASLTFSFKTELYLMIFRSCLKNQLLHSLHHCCPVLTQKSLACGNTLFFYQQTKPYAHPEAITRLIQVL